MDGEGGAHRQASTLTIHNANIIPYMFRDTQELPMIHGLFNNICKLVVNKAENFAETI